MTYSAVNLSQLAPPDVVEALDFEVILAEMKAEMIRLMPELTEALALESEPVVKILEVCAYRELLLRARVNDAARAVLLATAGGTNLEHLAALYGVERLLISEGDPDAMPPIPPTYEDDASLRLRTQMAPEGMTNAGTLGSYIYHALSADAQVRDVGVFSPAPGTVHVTVLSRSTTGDPSAELLTKVAEQIDVARPLCDTIVVDAPVFVPFAVEAVLYVTSAPGAGVAAAAAEAAVAAYLAEAFRVGQPIRRAALVARLMQVGVENVVLIQPAADIDPGATGVARVTSTTLTVEVAA